MNEDLELEFDSIGKDLTKTREKHIDSIINNSSSDMKPLLIKLRDLYSEVNKLSIGLTKYVEFSSGISKTNSFMVMSAMQYFDNSTLNSEIHNMESIINTMKKYEVLGKSPDFVFYLQVNSEKTYTDKGREVWKYKGTNVVINKTKSSEPLHYIRPDFSGSMTTISTGRVTTVHANINEHLIIKIPNNWNNIQLDSDIFASVKSTDTIGKTVDFLTKPVIDLYIKSLEQLNIDKEHLRYNIKNKKLNLYVNEQKLETI